MPIYNAGDFLVGALESVVQQTHTNWELVLIDDKSTDGSLDVARTYAEKYSKITLLENDVNRGCYYTRNRGLYEFKDKEWDFFTIHDPDDISDVRRFEKILKPFEDDNLIGMNTTYIKKNTTLNEYVTLPNGKYDIYASEGIAIYRRFVFDKLGYFDDTRFAGDTEYQRRLNLYIKDTKYKVTNHNEVLYVCHLHGSNLTVIHPVNTRGEYYKTVNLEHQQMITTQKFYKNFNP